MSDPFGTGAIRERVLAAWSAAPVRFREDANTEEDFALGGYRDRLLVELAQNAADAAVRAGVPGRLRLVLRDEPRSGAVLVAANTGAPLTAAGVESLATLRASSKGFELPGRPEPGQLDPGRPSRPVVGRFGVGFAAVLAVTDEPMVLSRTGGVRFSRDDTAELVAEAARTAPALGDEVRRRAGHVPVLRLPFEAEGEPPNGFDTAVVLPLRDEPAVDLVRRLLAEADDALLLALPGLERIEIDVDGSERALADVDGRWRVYRAGGTWSPDERDRLLADRPTEERFRPGWSVLWAVRRDDQAGLPQVLYAPTPTDEPMSLPALLIGSFPLDPARRHVAPGPLTERLVELVADAYAAMVRERAESGYPITEFVPLGLPAGALDGALREAILAALAVTPILPSVEEPGRLLRPRDAVVVADAGPELLRTLGPVVGGLVLPGWDSGGGGVGPGWDSGGGGVSPGWDSGGGGVSSGARAAYDALGVRRIPLADLVDELAGVGAAHPPEWWRQLYEALTESVRDPQLREALGGLPVPLADGRLVRGPRGLILLPTATVPSRALADLAAYGLRVVHPDAAHEVLERLGAVQAGPRTLLSDGAVRMAVANSDQADDPDRLAASILTLVQAAVTDGDLRPGELPWLGELALPDEDGELTSADALVLPGSEAEELLDPDEFAPVDSGLLDRFGPGVLEAAGVVRTLGLVTAADVELHNLPEELSDLPGLTVWADQVSGGVDEDFGGTAGELTVIRDLDYVDRKAWPRALQLIAGEPGLREALVRPVQVTAADGTTRQVLPYTAWWIRRHVHVEGVPVAGLADPDAEPAIAALLPPAPGWLAGLDPTVRSAAGLVTRARELDSTGVRQLLARLADESVRLDAPALLALWSDLARLDPATTLDESPRWVRVLDGTGSKVVNADDAVVADVPMWLQRTDLGGFLIAPGQAAARLGDLFDLPLASECAAGKPGPGGEPSDVPDVVRLAFPDLPARWREHEELLVDGQEVDWWVDADGEPHAATVEGLARALAWSSGQWSRRLVIEALLTEPDRLGDILADLPYDRRPPVPD